MFGAHPILTTFYINKSGKSNFGYIYGVGLFGTASIYFLLNLMSETGIDAYRVASVLGYCLLPMVVASAIGVIISFEYVPLFFPKALGLTYHLNQVEQSDISYPSYQFCGAHIPRQEFLWPCSGCQSNDYLSHILSVCYMAVLLC